jgi:GntR family transcriptional regulator
VLSVRGVTSTQWEPAPIAGRQRRRADDVRRVRDLLRQELAVLSAGTGILPDERLLALQLRASRNAVREALNLLRDEGFVERRQGRGTIVTTPPPHRMQGGRGLVNSVAGGERVHYEALWHHDAPASATVAEQLGIAPGDAVLVLERLTSIDGVPTCLWTSYLRRDEGLRVAATPCDGDGYELLEAALGIEVAQVDLCVEAVLADASVAEILQVRGGQPLLRLSRVITDATGRTVALGFGRALGNRMAMAFSSRRPARRRPADDASQHLG